MPMVTRLRSGAGRRVDYVSLAGLKRRKVPARRRRWSGKPKASAALKKVVTSIVRKQAETKNVMRVLDNYTLYNSAITTPDWVYPVPDILPGTAETQRVGDKIKPKALIVKLHVAFNSQVGGYETIMVRVHVVKHKKFTSQSQLALNMPVDGQKLLVDGNGAQLPYDGTIQHSQYVVNTDLWTEIKTLNFTLSKDNTAPAQGIRSASLLFVSRVLRLWCILIQLSLFRRISVLLWRWDGVRLTALLAIRH